MSVVTYEEKINYMNRLLKRCMLSSFLTDHDLDILESIKEDIEQLHQLEEQCKKRRDKKTTDIYEEMFLK